MSGTLEERHGNAGDLKKALWTKVLRASRKFLGPKKRNIRLFLTFKKGQMFRISRGIDRWGPQNVMRCALYPYRRVLQRTRDAKMGEASWYQGTVFDGLYAMGSPCFSPIKRRKNVENGALLGWLNFKKVGECQNITRLFSPTFLHFVSKSCIIICNRPYGYNAHFIAI